MKLSLSLKKLLSSAQKMVGLEVFILKNGTYRFHALLLEKEKTTIRVVATYENLPDLNTLTTFLKPSIPLVLIVGGKGVLHKKRNDLPEEPTDILKSSLPNVQPEAFIFSTYPEKDFYWLVVLRKQVVLDLVEKLSELSLFCTHLYLSPYPIRHVFPFLDIPDSQLPFGNYQLHIENGQLLAIEKTQAEARDSINIAGEKLALKLLPAFAAAFQALMNIEEPIYHADFITQSKQNFKYTRAFYVLGWSALVGLFSILLLNFFMFSRFYDQHQQLDMQLVSHQKNLKKLQQLKDQYQEEQYFFQQNSALEASKISYYANEIGRTIPNGIKLINLTIFPPKGKNRQKKTKNRFFEQHIIRVEGQSMHSFLLNDWINQLEKLEWIQQVAVLPYSENTKGQGNFDLLLSLVPKKK